MVRNSKVVGIKLNYLNYWNSLRKLKVNSRARAKARLKCSETRVLAKRTCGKKNKTSGRRSERLLLATRVIIHPTLELYNKLKLIKETNYSLQVNMTISSM